ncbi:MAG TPA: non-homologous end-joining DNA ligase, partial [Parasegetibacter sp.]
GKSNTASKRITTSQRNAASKRNTKKLEAIAGSELSFGRIKVPISNATKIYWPDEEINKGMMINYYQSIADVILPYLKDRPQSLKRNPGGINDQGFFHKDAGEQAPDWVKTYPVYSESSNKTIDYIICNNKATLAYLNNLGCIELNPWHSRTNKDDYPDYLIIDIDPSEKNNFEEVIETAQCFKELCDVIKIDSFCKTSGATGLHIYIPMGRKYQYEEVKDFARLLCMLVNDRLPAITSMERSLKKRGNMIYLDYLQNRRGQTIASVYSLRPRPGATVSAPLNWNEVKKGVRPSDFNIYNMTERLRNTGDIFKGILGAGINMRKSLEILESTGDLE